MAVFPCLLRFNQNSFKGIKVFEGKEIAPKDDKEIPPIGGNPPRQNLKELQERQKKIEKFKKDVEEGKKEAEEDPGKLRRINQRRRG